MQRAKRGLDKHSAGGVADGADGVAGTGSGLVPGLGSRGGAETRSGENDYENEGMIFAGRRRGATGGTGLLTREGSYGHR